jgi:predicted nucleic acid-binding protein
MPAALVDTELIHDYLRGDTRAKQAIEPYAHRSISVVTWLEVMARCPAGLEEPTRAFLRTFERLSIGESIADEALRLMQQYPGLTLPRALTWATARVNQLRLITSDPRNVPTDDAHVLHAYVGRALT